MYSSIFGSNNLFGFCTVSSSVLIKYRHPETKQTYTYFAENRYNHEKKIGIFRSLIGPYLGISSLMPKYAIDTTRRILHKGK